MTLVAIVMHTECRKNPHFSSFCHPKTFFLLDAKQEKNAFFSSKDETKLEFDGSAPMNPNAQTFFQEKNGF
jgi:hypothetical protein